MIRASADIADPADPRHGTNAGVKAHDRAKVPVCDRCRNQRNTIERARTKHKRATPSTADRTCEDCERPMVPKNHLALDGTVVHAGRGLCNGCYGREKRVRWRHGLTEAVATARPPAGPHTYSADAERYAQAACALAVWPDLWHSTRPGDIHEAVAVCQTCSIRQSCLSDALAEEDGATDHCRWGIRGGLTAAQRSALDTGPRPLPRRVSSAHIADPDDPRHGTPAGRSAHERFGTPVCERCRYCRRAAR